ncbi:MAG TPA: metallophosphoesterase, partial [Baekduia sp.]|nr:metallophosphoesterase [Baekduia sp.]
ADLHCTPGRAAYSAHAFQAISTRADLILLAGDLTSHGQPDQAHALADAARPVELPIVACMGNHDMHYERTAELVPIWQSAGITILEREHTILEIAGRSVGIVGLKGFVGGFADAHIEASGEPVMRELYSLTTIDVEDLDKGLQAISGCDTRLVLMHYSPTAQTLVGEPEGLWSMLGSDRFAAPIERHRPDLVVHGHAHAGSFEGKIGSVPVYNVSIPVMRRDFWLFTLS